MLGSANKYADILVSCMDEKTFKAEVVSEYHTLIRVLSGEMKIIQADCSYTLGEGDILMVPRNQMCAVIKRPKDGRPFTSIVVTFKPERLKDYYARRKPVMTSAFTQKIKVFDNHPLLESYFASIHPYFELTSTLPDELASLKIEEGITILRTLDKEVDSLLADFSAPGKIDLSEFMEKNFMFNLPLTKFSYLTGRSIATFNRDFRKAFNTTPQKWLIQKRLELAHYQLMVKKRKPVDIYIEAGFENMSHFSFAFKKHYGYPPTALPDSTF